ncbi:DUF982 domain-containing protein [Mesorhizobium sp. AR10]|uniref:DUF982 domain-containing protein n=1 Tax=Mesorhizobium sp. AR10 TaxID=2865839 RepID=UPI0021600747|nr:DUF982 domain-containing protein [Mesorhizobium sp. AR10]UVK37615.1 DUF982 domain-containing protein [Mesorhizobium sp. AR10]
MEHPFNDIPIESANGDIRVVSNLLQITDALTDGRWPSDGPMFLAALAALVEARMGRGSSRDVQRAFISAAMEADVLPASFMKS